MRSFTTTAAAAGHYRAAARAACGGADPVPHLDAATDADGGFAVAVVDLAVLTGRPVPPVSRPATRWEREHLDVVRAHAAGHRCRAHGLLHEHLADGGCDPLAELIVRDGSTGAVRECAVDECPFAW